MKSLSEFLKKESKFFIYAMIVVVALVAVVTKVSVSYIGRLLERSNTILLNEISEESSNLISEKINTDVEALTVAADIIGREEDIFSYKNMEHIQILAQDQGYNKVFLIDMDGNMRSSNGEYGKQVTIVARVKRNNVVISDIVTTDAGEKLLTISVPIMQRQQMIGALTGVYQAENYSHIMETTLFGGKGTHYILKTTGEAIVLPEEEVYPFAFDYESSFETNNPFSSHHELSKLPQEMQQKKTGIIRFFAEENTINYMAYRPLNVNDWYLLSMIPAGQYSLQNITDIVIKFALVMDIIIILLVGIVLVNYKGNKKGVGNTDTITQLENKQKIQKFYENVYKGKKDYIFAMIGIHDFNLLNYTFGYQEGSHILKEMANIISASLEEGEVAARLKEDNFGLLLKVKNKSEATTRLQGIVKNLKQIKVMEGDTIYSDTIFYSVGVNLLNNKEEFEPMLSHTIATLEIAKQFSGEKIMFYDQELRQQMILHDELLPDVLQAIHYKEFVPYFQMQFDTEQKEFMGAEVIIAWKHAQKGIIMPEKYIPVLKTTGMLLDLDMILLEEVCKTQKDYINRGLVPLPLTVGISRLNVHRIDFVSKLKTIVERYQVSPSLIILEIQEQAIYDDIDRNVKIIAACKEYGFMISIGDFSSGHSFLDVMRRVPTDSIKLSGEFLPQGEVTEKDRIVVKKIIDVAKELGIQVIGEGIKTENQLKFLKSMGCSVVQGYSYPEPVPEEEFEEMIFHDEM